MKQIETNFLIYDLAKKAKPVTKTSPFKFIFLSIAISIIYILFYLLTSELRFNLAEVVSQSLVSTFYLQLIIFSISGVLGTYLSYKHSIPGQTEGKGFKVLNFLFYAMWLVLFMVMATLAYQDYAENHFFDCDWHCIERALLGLTLPLATIIYFTKKGYVLESKQAVMTASLTAFSFASFLNLFICPATSALHVFCSHNLVILPIIFLFIMLLSIFKKKRG